MDHLAGVADKIDSVATQCELVGDWFRLSRRRSPTRKWAMWPGHYINAFASTIPQHNCTHSLVINSTLNSPSAEHFWRTRLCILSVKNSMWNSLLFKLNCALCEVFLINCWEKHKCTCLILIIDSFCLWSSRNNHNSSFLIFAAKLVTSNQIFKAKGKPKWNIINN